MTTCPAVLPGTHHPRLRLRALLPAGLSILLLGLCGCAFSQMAQQGAMGRAYSAIDRGDYRSALKRLAEAEKFQPPTPELKAEIAFLKAKSYEGLKDLPSAIGLYRYIVATFFNSPYSYQAQERLVVLGKGVTPASPAASVPPGGPDPLPPVDSPPVVVSQTRPAYPAEMEDRKTPGEARVEFDVEADGSVRNVRLVSATNDAFGTAAVAFVQQWIFRPALKAGVPVRAHMQVPVVFRFE